MRFYFQTLIVSYSEGSMEQGGFATPKAHERCIPNGSDQQAHTGHPSKDITPGLPAFKISKCLDKTFLFSYPLSVRNLRHSVFRTISTSVTLTPSKSWVWNFTLSIQRHAGLFSQLSHKEKKWRQLLAELLSPSYYFPVCISIWLWLSWSQTWISCEMI